MLHSYNTLKELIIKISPFQNLQNHSFKLEMEVASFVLISNACGIVYEWGLVNHVFDSRGDYTDEKHPACTRLLFCTVVHSHEEKAMAPHSRTLPWKIPWTEEPGGLQSMGSLRVGHDWEISLSLFTLTHWRRKWQPTPVFLPGESQGRGSLVGGRLWGCTESDTTEAS